MIAPRQRVLYAFVAVVGGALLTLAFVWMIAALNRPEVVSQDVGEPIRCALVEPSPSASRESGQPHHEPSPAQSQPQVMPVAYDVALPAAQVVDSMIAESLAPESMDAIDAVDFDVALPSPNVGAIQVAARRMAAAPASQMQRQNATAQQTSARETSDSTEQRIPNAEEVDQPPREPAGNAKPVYPAREKQLGIEGTVLLRLLIDERGRVADVEVISGGMAFRNAVLQVARSWRFEPARHQGRATKVWGVKEVSFVHPRNRR